ncbi:MAG: hypothetical protein U1B94_01410 [candidate division NC10 bacterium]|nr:hypothetical protein [candidate division NC10 bacterium]
MRTVLGLCHACYQRLRDRRTCVQCLTDRADTGTYGRCAECHRAREAARSRVFRHRWVKSPTPRAQVVTRLVGRVEVRSIECPRFFGAIPVATCLAWQGDGCLCDRGEQLLQIMAAGMPVASGEDDDADGDQDLALSEAAV